VANVSQLDVPSMPARGANGAVGSQGISMLYAVKQVELAIRHALDSLLRPTGVGTVAYTALTVLERHDGLTASELARTSFVTAQTMSELVVGLERRGLVHRDPDPDHARRLLVRLTLAGREFVHTHRPAIDEVERRMLSRLSPSEAALLADLLQRCRRSLHVEPPR
jgi:DNA-binding MarR family transcriptional regulator